MGGVQQSSVPAGTPFPAGTPTEFQLELIKKAWPELHFSEFQFQLELMAGTGTLLFSYTVQSKRFGV
jgi:hypothetical protein